MVDYLSSNDYSYVWAKCSGNLSVSVMVMIVKNIVLAETFEWQLYLSLQLWSHFDYDTAGIRKKYHNIQATEILGINF